MNFHFDALAKGVDSIVKVAVVGGGTAGFLAAAHMSHFFPDCELFHIYDSHLPSIGVGEGTIPSFPPWLEAITGLDFPALQERCQATLKLGIRFENWGRAYPIFFHNFSAGSYAYHISAAGLPAVLQESIRATRIDRRVVELASSGREVAIRFAEGAELQVDFAFDARGFPQTLRREEHERIPGIPTNAALIRRGPVAALQGGTRAVARPEGWIFVIPLAGHTSYGYVFNQETTPPAAAQRDFDAFFRAEQIIPQDAERSLRFPCFRQRTFFDGALFKIGNTASFLEPLEATAIGLILLQLQVAGYWLGDQFVGISGEEKRRPSVLAENNRELAESIQAVGRFVSWHYARGSVYDTPFWRQARRGFEHALDLQRETAVGCKFQAWLAGGAQIPEAYLPFVRDREIYAAKIAPMVQMDDSVGGFDEVNFAQVGYGLGYFHGRHNAGQLPE